MIEKTDAYKSNFYKVILNTICLTSVFSLLLLVKPVYAGYLCQDDNSNIEPCVNNIAPNGWVWCGAYNGDTILCDPTPDVERKSVQNIGVDQSAKKRRFYVGLSLGYVGYSYGKLTADYSNNDNAWKIPGAFFGSEFESEPRVIPIQLSFGATIVDNFRIDLSYMHYSGFGLPGRIKSAPNGNYAYYNSVETDGGDISGSNLTMGIYYNFDKLTGKIFANKISPYLGFGIGYGTNKISDYEINNAGYVLENGQLNISDISSLHYGGRTDNLTYLFEIGGTAEITEILLIDIFARWTYLGHIKSSGNILQKQSVQEGSKPPYNQTLFLEGWSESGTLGMLDIGLRLKFLF